MTETLESILCFWHHKERVNSIKLMLLISSYTAGDACETIVRCPVHSVCTCVNNDYDVLRFRFSGGLRNFCLFRRRGHFGRSRASKVTDIGANRKRICDFLLFRNVIVTLDLSCTVSEIRQVLCASDPIPIQP